MHSHTVGLSTTMEGDGIVSTIYEVLWKRKAGTMGLDSDVRLASTVVYENNFPKAWFVYNERTGGIDRRIGAEVTPSLIEYEFGKRSSSKRTHNLDDGGDLVAKYFCTVRNPEDGEMATRVEFLNKARLGELVTNHSRRPDGFLQKWIPSQGKYNTVVEAVWTPHHCHVEKRQNIRGLRDKRYGTYDRAVTYEGPSHYSKEAFVAPHIRWQIRIFCQDIVDHIYSVERIHVAGMVMHFKVDPECAIWFLWCSSMRTQRSQLNLAPVYLRAIPGEDNGDNHSEAERLERLLRFVNVHGTDKDVNSLKEPVEKNIPNTLGSFIPIPPPTMGPMGDCYSVAPQWTVRNAKKLKEAVQAAQMRGAYYAGVPVTVARRIAQKHDGRTAMGSVSQLGGETLPEENQSLNVTREPQQSASRRNRGNSFLMQFAKHIATHTPNCIGMRIPPVKKKPKMMWATVRRAVRCGYFHALHCERYISEWLCELMEVTAACETWPLDVTVPSCVSMCIGTAWLANVFVVVENNKETDEVITLDGLCVRSMLHAHTFLVTTLVRRLEAKRRAAHLCYLVRKYVTQSSGKRKKSPRLSHF